MCSQPGWIPINIKCRQDSDCQQIQNPNVKEVNVVHPLLLVVGVQIRETMFLILNGKCVKMEVILLEKNVETQMNVLIINQIYNKFV
ncbi:unnamed protein product [Meloidogyne enterolobii]|uniref:Uncharacterized protein n=1 Tax=Meloidogyne enterolobii TaxID=390850 RepID=A0ACB0XTH7_MELEN